MGFQVLNEIISGLISGLGVGSKLRRINLVPSLLHLFTYVFFVQCDLIDGRTEIFWRNALDDQPRRSLKSLTLWNGIQITDTIFLRDLGHIHLGQDRLNFVHEKCSFIYI